MGAYRYFVAGLILTLTPLGPSVAEEPPDRPDTPHQISASQHSVSVHGFGDLIFDPQSRDSGELFSLGQAELNLESELNDRNSLLLYIAYTGQSFEIGEFIFSWTAWGSQQMRPTEIAGITSLVVGGGQFDIPFGIDWQVYQSKNRKLISTPIAVERTHDSWNDLGAFAFVEASWGNVALYGANGLCFEGEDYLGKELIAETELSLGGRIGLSPFPQLEIGASRASIDGQSHSTDMDLMGVDLQVRARSLEVRAEYIAHRFEPRDTEAFTNTGCYVQGLFRMADWYVVSRFGEFRQDGDRSYTSRLSTGLGRIINQSLQVRIEHQMNYRRQNTLLLQSVFVF